MKKRNLFSAVVIAALTLYLLLPMAITFLYSIVTEWTDILPTGLTLRNYIDLFGQADFFLALGRTLLLCVLPIALTILIILLALYTVLIYFPKLEKYLQLLCMVPYAIQGVILSVSILSLYSGAPGFLSNRLVMLLGAYCIVILPYIFQGIRNSMNAVNMPMLLEAAEMLGSTKLHAFFKVILPNILSGVTVSALLAMGIVFGDYVLIQNLVGNSFQNVQIYLHYQMKLSSGRGSAVFVVIFLVTLLITALVLYIKSKDNAQRAKAER